MQNYTATDRQAALDLYFFLTDKKYHTNYNMYLYALIAKADDTNYRRIGKVYPIHCELWRQYKTQEDTESFLERMKNGGQ